MRRLAHGANAELGELFDLELVFRRFELLGVIELQRIELQLGEQLVLGELELQQLVLRELQLELQLIELAVVLELQLELQFGLQLERLGASRPRRSSPARPWCRAAAAC